MTPLERMIHSYDRALLSSNYHRYFEDSGFYNFGYWDGHPASQREACEALLDVLTSRLGKKGGRILDVACGPGASTKHLMRHYAPKDITAINISEAQIDAARKRAPGCSVLLMDAARLAFPSGQFDAVICVEAAFHFNTRDAFFREALRVLKPGGSLVLSDMLFRGFMKPIGEFGQVPRANFVPDVPSYGARLAAAGFEGIEVRDATQACLGGFRRHLARWPLSEHRKGRMAPGKAAAASLAAWGIAQYFKVVCKSYLIASARKPSLT